jgi:hypothetical protein
MEDLSDEIYKVLVASGVHVGKAADISHKLKERARLKDEGKKYIEMNLDELIAEHKKLLKVLESGDDEALKKEAQDQADELQSYIDKKKGSLKADGTLLTEKDDIAEYFTKVRLHLLEQLDAES